MMELVKTYSLSPGNNLFFYRDQNGVEIDFFIEIKGRLILIEAKAGERIAPRKLHFDRVAALFENRFQIEKFLAQNVKESKILKMKNYTCFNPIYSAPLSQGIC